MLGTLTPQQKDDWKSHVPALAHAYNCTRNATTGFSPYYLLFGRESRLGESGYISQLRRRLKFAHNKAKQMANRQQARHKGLYD